MPDLSLCIWRRECCLSPMCYRATAEPDDVKQSYFAPNNPGRNCPCYIPIEEGKRKQIAKEIMNT